MLENSAPRYNATLEETEAIIKISWFAKSPKQAFC